MIELYNDDCLLAMSKIPNESVDLILCDLPYGITQNKDDIRLPFDKLWEQYRRIINKNGTILLFGSGIFYVDLVNSNRAWFKYDLVWDKCLTSGFLNAKRMPLRRHEQIAVFRPNGGVPVYNPQMTKGSPLHSKGVNYKNKEFTNNNYGKFNTTDDSRSGCTDKYPTSIVTVKKSHPSVAKHRTEKPVELLEWLIKTYTDDGATVLDNCMGAGSCGVACVNTNRNFVGIEIDEHYFSVAKSQIAEAVEKRLKSS